MTTAEMPGLRVDSTMTWLAALGTLYVLTREHPDSQFALSWKEDALGGFHPVIHGAGTVNDIADSLTNAAAFAAACENPSEWCGEPWVPDSGQKGGDRALTRFDLDEYRDAARATIGGPATGEWLAAVVTDLAPRGDGPARKSVLYLLNAQMRFAFNAVEAARLAPVQPDGFLGALTRPRRTTVKGTWCAGYLDTTAPLVEEKSERRWMLLPATAWLAIMGFPFMPVVGDGQRAWTRGSYRDDRGWWVRMPVWQPPLTAAGVRTMLGLPALALTDGDGAPRVADGAAARGFGVSGVFVARRETDALNDHRDRLAPPVRAL